MIVDDFFPTIDEFIQKMFFTMWRLKAYVMKSDSADQLIDYYRIIKYHCWSTDWKLISEISDSVQMPAFPSY